jgi:hypothetical protein
MLQSKTPILSLSSTLQNESLGLANQNAILDKNHRRTQTVLVGFPVNVRKLSQPCFSDLAGRILAGDCKFVADGPFDPRCGTVEIE